MSPIPSSPASIDKPNLDDIPLVKAPLIPSAASHYAVWLPDTASGFDREIFRLPARRSPFLDLALAARQAGAPKTDVYLYLAVALSRGSNDILYKNNPLKLPFSHETYEALLEDPELDILETRIEVVTARRRGFDNQPILPESYLTEDQRDILDGLKLRKGHSGIPLELLWSAMCAMDKTPEDVELDIRRTAFWNFPGLSHDNIRMEIHDKSAFEHMTFAVEQNHRGYAAIEWKEEILKSPDASKALDLPPAPTSDPEVDENVTEKWKQIVARHMALPPQYHRETITIGQISLSSSAALREVVLAENSLAASKALQEWNDHLNKVRKPDAQKYSR